VMYGRINYVSGLHVVFPHGLHVSILGMALAIVRLVRHGQQILSVQG